MPSYQERVHWMSVHPSPFATIFQYIFHVTGSSLDLILQLLSAGVSTGIEMSGGVSNITVENVNAWASHRGMRIKTASGRGGYVRDISCCNVTLDDVRVGLVIKTDYNEHLDTEFDSSAVPVLENISYIGIHGQGVRVPVRIHGSEEVPVKGVSFQDMSVGISYKKKHIPVLFC